MHLEDFLLTKPQLKTTGRMTRLSTDTDPTEDDDGGELMIGQEMLLEDTGMFKYWDGNSWEPVTFSQKLLQFFELQFEIRDEVRIANSTDV